MTIRFPPSRQPIAGGSVIDPHWERWFGDLAREVNTAATSTPAPPVEYPSFVINGAGSVTAAGAVAAGEFAITLVGDKDSPPPNSFYGADSAGEKGFVPLYDGLEEGQGIALRDSGYIIMDTVATPADLPLTGNTGEAVRVTESEVGIYAWDGSAFTLDTAATGVVSVTCDATAAEIPYDNTTSGLAATEVQAAIDEVAGSGTYVEGTTFPGSPPTGQKFYRTDLQVLCYYDGTRWLTAQEYEIGAGLSAGVGGITTTGDILWIGPVRSDYGLYLTRWVCTARVLSGNSGTSYWTGALSYQDSANLATTISSFATSADTSNTPVAHDVQINTVLNAAAKRLVISGTKTGTPGALVAASALYYRLIVT